MHPADIQAALKKKGVTQKQIAQELGVSEMPVSKEVNGIHTSERIRRAIAETIGMDPKMVFAEYYLKKNRRR